MPSSFQIYIYEGCCNHSIEALIYALFRPLVRKLWHYWSILGTEFIKGLVVRVLR